MHNLVADRFGNAIVVETGENENQITKMKTRLPVFWINTLS